jgi:hypothetical protein
MWSSAPAAQGPVRQAPPDLATRTPPAGATGEDPLEAYFDQLDAAFSSAGSTHAAADSFAGQPAAPAPAARRDTIPLSRRPAPSAPQTNSGDPLAGWDPDLIGDPTRPAAVEAPPPVARAAVAVAAPQAPVASVAPPAPAAAPPTILPASLVDAFTALLSAEQKIGLSPSAATAPSPGAAGSAPAAITDDVIDAVAERVLAKLSAQSRPDILDVAERLVREEIERLKQ